MTQLRKGVDVWFFRNWNNRSTVAAARLTLQSIGKRQATATRIENGKFVKNFIYARDYGNLVPVADLPDPTEEGLRRATAQRLTEIERRRNQAHWYSDGGDNDAYHAHMKRECEAVINEAPTVVIR